MKIQSKRREISEILSIIGGLVSTILLIEYYIPHFPFVRLPYEFSLFINFLYGIFISIVIGLLFGEDSRIGGLLLASILLPLLFYFTSVGEVIVKALVVGIVLGVIIELYVLPKGRFDIAASFSKMLLSSFFIIIFAYLSLSMCLYSPIEHLYEYVTGFFLLFLPFVISIKSIRGTKAGKVFVFGQTISGKTYLLLSWHHYWEGAHIGEGKIISGNPRDLEITEMLKKVADGEKIRSTGTDELAEYEFISKKWGIIDVRVIFADYGGGILSKDTLTADFHTNYIKIKKKLEEELGLEKAGDIELLKRKWWKNLKFPGFISYIITAYLYEKLKDAGKIIALIDGKIVKEFIESGRGEGELILYFGMLNQILWEFKDKKFAFVVTKADELDGFIRERTKKGLVDIVDEKGALEIEREVYKELRRIDEFKGTIRQASHIIFPAHFYLVSVDIRKNNREEIDPKNIWELGHKRIERFVIGA